MLTNHDCQWPVRRQFGRLIIGGLVLFGCGQSSENGKCGSGGECTAAGGHSSVGGASNLAGHATRGGTPGAGATGAGTTSASGGSLSHAGGSVNGGANGTLGGTTSDAGTGSTFGGASAEGGSPEAGASSTICPPGAFDHDGDPNNPCKAWSRCPPGQYIAKEGSDTRDRVCAICGTGTFSVSQNVRACSPWTDCATNTYVSQVGSTTADQKCSACASAQSSCLPAGACLFSGACPAGTVQIAPGSGTTPAQCKACGSGDYCAGGLTPQVRCDSGTWDHDGAPGTCCAAWETCAAGQYISKAGSAVADRECKSCATGSFSLNANSAQCAAWTECSSKSTTWPQGGIATAGTATSDAVCADPYARFGSPESDGGTAIAVDGSGNVYVAGSTTGGLEGANAGSSDAFVRKLDPSGATLWTRQFGTSSDDQAAGVAVDGNGNVYVAGSTSGGLEGANAGSSDAFVRKFDPSGTTLWTRQFGSLGPESARGLVVDGSGNAYVTGSTYPTGGQGSGDPFVRKLDASGATAWSRQFGGADEDEAFAVAVDGSGNVYVGGYTFDLIPASNQGQRDAFVRKLDASGATVWTRQFGTSDNDYVNAAGVDGSGNLYVAGLTGGALGGSSLGSGDGFVRKFDPAGTAIWTQQVGTSGSDHCSAVAIDGTNNVYAVGSTDGAFAGSSAGSSDVYVRKLDPSGATLWTQQFGTSSNDSAQGAVATPTGNVYVVGYKGDFFNANADAFVLQVPAP